MIVDFNWAVLGVGLAVLAGLLLWLRLKKGKSLAYLILFSLFWFYLLWVAKLTLFPFIIVERAGYEPSNIFLAINLTPFYGGRFSTGATTWNGIWQNFLLTIPFGFGFWFLTRIPLRRVTGVSLIAGSSIELTQLFISFLLGYNYRVVDINDVIGNTAGIFAGTGFFWLLTKVRARIHSLMFKR